MSYQETVRRKIESSTARQEERSELWVEICSAYEEGGTQGVESMLANKMAVLAVQFRHVLAKLDRML